jgi:hypothetical protein
MSLFNTSPSIRIRIRSERKKLFVYVSTLSVCIRFVFMLLYVLGLDIGVPSVKLFYLLFLFQKRKLNQKSQKHQLLQGKSCFSSGTILKSASLMHPPALWVKNYGGKGCSIFVPPTPPVIVPSASRRWPWQAVWPASAASH